MLNELFYNEKNVILLNGASDEIICVSKIEAKKIAKREFNLL